MTGNRTITQIQGRDGQPLRANEQPNWFVSNGPDKLDELLVDDESVVKWNTMPAFGEVFGAAKPGHDVEFYIGGDEYFRRVAAAIRSARKSVFIAGWQINYAVEMGDGTKLLSCLDTAVGNGADVYVMPWLAPPGPVDTGYLHTLLAVYHLNGGDGASNASRPGRAYCLPAIGQSDMESMAPFFSHHQKLVVVDNERAFAGGIDLAYGRREDSAFRLKAGGRRLNEIHNPSIPAIKTPKNVELVDCVTLPELIVAGFLPAGVRQVPAFFLTPAAGPGGLFARTLDLINSAGSALGGMRDGLQDFADRNSLIDPIVDRGAGMASDALDTGQDALDEALGWLWGRLPEITRAQLDELYRRGGQDFRDSVNLMWDALRGMDVTRLPYRTQVFSAVAEGIDALVGVMVSRLAAGIGRFQRYDRLFDKMEQHPGAGGVVDPECQPRQPFHDVQCGIQGPAVYELSLNFVQRWNGIAKRYSDGFGRFRSNPLARFFSLLFELGQPNGSARAQVGAIPARHVPVAPAPGGADTSKCVVQVLRSAPSRMLRDEVAAGAQQSHERAQDNCLKAMLKAIHGAQKFIYIEGQFYQCDHGGFNDAFEPGRPLSGPAGSVVSPMGLEHYERYARRMGIENQDLGQLDPRNIRWGRAIDVIRDPEYGAFVNSVSQIVTNLRTNLMVDALESLSGPRQSALRNPVGKALARRIERAIDDGLPFHAYLVLPAHPEGKLNELSIMRQVDLTMLSLVHGPQSLVNCVRRALVAKHERENNGLSVVAAREKARNMLLEELLQQDAGEEWTNYLTLLTLRNHAQMGGRPVTEQVYVHSKLLIADDRVAVLGSANINDRSMLGTRDSELAVIIAGGEKTQVKLDGENSDQVSKVVHQFRRRLWETLFGKGAGEEGVQPADGLLQPAVLDHPASPDAWKSIKIQASQNAAAYEAAFAFVPRNHPHPLVNDPQSQKDEKRGAALWPTWSYPDDWWNGDAAQRAGRARRRGRLAFRMPFDPLFWRAATRSDDAGQHAWNVGYGPHSRPGDIAGVAPESNPQGVKGFITAMPVNWVWQESNNTGLSLAVLAENESARNSGKDRLAANESIQDTGTEATG